MGVYSKVDAHTREAEVIYPVDVWRRLPDPRGLILTLSQMDRITIGHSQTLRSWALDVTPSRLVISQVTTADA